MTPKTVTFVGTPSGDCECFCWDVSAVEFRRATGRVPSVQDRAVDLETGVPPADRYRLYPNDLPFHGYPDRAEGRPLRITVVVETAGEGS